MRWWIGLMSVVGVMSAASFTVVANEPWLDEPPITVPDDPFDPPPTEGLRCVSEGIVADRGPFDEDNLTGDWEQDVQFDCRERTLTVTLDASTIRELIANAESRS